MTSATMATDTLAARPRRDLVKLVASFASPLSP